MEEHVHPQYQDYTNLKNKKMQYNMQPQVYALTHKPKYLYPYFNVFELEYNRLSDLEQYKVLAGQIDGFNRELKAWKDQDVEVRNLFTSYHLYQNLFSRMKFTSNLVLDREGARRSYIEIAKWYFEEKPKIRNKVPDKGEGKMKPSTADRQTVAEEDSLLVYNVNKREMKVYESMSRTVHKDFFPPKERLLEYKRKDILQGGFGEGEQKVEPRRAMSVQTLSGKGRYRKSFGSTRTSLVRTSDVKKQEENREPAVVPFQMEEVKERQEQPDQRELDDLEREKLVNQEQMLQDNLVPENLPEDQPDEQYLSEQQQREETKKVFQKYRQDPDADLEMKAEERIKDAKQSTLRRILKQKEEAIRKKMQQLNVAKHMKNWAAIKAKNNTEQHRRAERMTLANRFTETKYTPKTFQERRSARKKEIPEYPILYRTKSSHPGSIERDVERIRISGAIKKYGRHINDHIEVKEIEPHSEEHRLEIIKMRSTSMTTLGRNSKKAPFSAVIEKNGTWKYNQDAQDDVLLTKERLAKKGVIVEKQQLMKAARVPQVDVGSQVQVFPPQKALFSNPFFPKHLYGPKKKKKK